MRKFLGLAAATACLNASAQISESDLPRLQARAKETGKSTMAYVRTPATPRQVKACVDAWRPLLRDPDSPKVVASKIHVSANPDFDPAKLNRSIVIEGRAANGFGGFVQQYFMCSIDGKGQVEPGSAELYQLLLKLTPEATIGTNFP